MKNIPITGAWLGVVLIVLAGCNRPGTRADAGAVEHPARATATATTLPQRASADEPLMVAIDPQLATVEHDLTAVPNDTSVTYTWSVNGRPLTGEFGAVLPKTNFRRSDVVSVEVALNDQRARAETTIQNSIPRAIEVSLGRPLDTLHQGLDLTATPKGVDADGDDIHWEYQWIRNGEPLATETTAVLPGDQFQRGDRITVQVTPSDSESRGEPYTPGTVTIPNGAPEFVSRPPAHTGGAEYVYQVQAADPDADQIHYRLVKGPAGMVVDETSGKLSWPLRGAPAGRNHIEIEVDDGVGGKASQPFELDIAFSEGS